MKNQNALEITRKCFKPPIASWNFTPDWQFFISSTDSVVINVKI